MFFCFPGANQAKLFLTRSEGLLSFKKFCFKSRQSEEDLRYFMSGWKIGGGALNLRWPHWSRSDGSWAAWFWSDDKDLRRKKSARSRFKVNRSPDSIEFR